MVSAYQSLLSVPPEVTDQASWAPTPICIKVCGAEYCACGSPCSSGAPSLVNRPDTTTALECHPAALAYPGECTAGRPLLTHRRSQQPATHPGRLYGVRCESSHGRSASPVVPGRPRGNGGRCAWIVQPVRVGEDLGCRARTQRRGPAGQLGGVGPLVAAEAAVLALDDQPRRDDVFGGPRAGCQADDGVLGRQGVGADPGVHSIAERLPRGLGRGRQPAHQRAHRWAWPPVYSRKFRSPGTELGPPSPWTAATVPVPVSRSSSACHSRSCATAYPSP